MYRKKRYFFACGSWGVFVAIFTEKGSIYVRVRIDIPCSLEMCAERNAIDRVGLRISDESEEEISEENKEYN